MRPLATRHALLALAAALTMGVPGAARAQSAAAAEAATAEAVIYLVRHAETTGEAGGDPPLSAAGIARAAAWAATLADAGVTRVYTTPYRRTTSTAEAVAYDLGVQVETYDPRDPAALLATVKQGGRFLVVGHSNTVPALVEALGGAPGRPIREDEHDRLYVVVLGGGHATTALLRQPPMPAGGGR